MWTESGRTTFFGLQTGTKGKEILNENNIELLILSFSDFCIYIKHFFYKWQIGYDGNKETVSPSETEILPLILTFPHHV